MDRVAANAVDVRACRICLATDAKFYALHKNDLAEIFTDLTTIRVFPSDGLPQYICNMCNLLLRKSAAFKAKCKNTNAFLRNPHFKRYPMTTEYISSLDTSRFKLPLTISETLVMSIPEENIEELKIEIKQEETPKIVNIESMSHTEIDKQNEIYIKFEVENPETSGSYSINDEMTTAHINTLDTSRFKLPSTISETQVFSVIPEENAANNNCNNSEILKTLLIKKEVKPSYILDNLKYNVKIDKQNEKPFKFEVENLETYSSNSLNDDVIIIDDDDDDDMIIIEEDDLDIQNKMTKNNNRKRKRISKDFVLDNNVNNVYYTEKLKNYLLNCKSRTKNANRLLFHDYVLSKYILRTREIRKPDADWDVENEDCNKTDDNQSSTKNNLQRDKFFNYISEKYIKRNKFFINNALFDISTAKVDINLIDKINAKLNKINARKNMASKWTKSEEEWDDLAKAFNFEIIRLTKEEQIKELQAKKESDRYKTSTFKCEHCCRGFAREAVFRNHMIVHDPSHGSHACDVCQQRFHTARKLKVHSQSHKRKCICKDCNRTFSSTTAAKEHYKFHQGTVYKCEYCGKTFRRYATRVEHIRLHHGRTPCDICYQMFQGEPAVTMHKSLIHKQTFPCSSCNEQFDNQTALDKHRGASYGDKCDPEKRPCRKCGEIFANDDLLTSHIENEHRKYKRRTYNEGENEVKKTIRRRVPCCPCKRIQAEKRRLELNNPSTLELNNPSALDRNTPSTLERNNSFALDRNIPSTLELNNPSALDRNTPSTLERNNPSALERNNPCALERSSPFAFDSNSSSVFDVYSPSTSGRYQPCIEENEVNSCDEQLESDNSFDVERDKLYKEGKVEVGTKGRPKAKRKCPCAGTEREARCPCRNYSTHLTKVMCEMCGLNCQTPAALRSHQRVHTGEKPFQCSYCDKRFRLKHGLEIHVRSHTGERPYQCPNCDKAFYNIPNLRRHELVHTKVRPYSCDVCGKTFQQSNDRKLHIQTVHMRIPQKPRVRNKRKKIE